MNTQLLPQGSTMVEIKKVKLQPKDGGLYVEISNMLQNVDEDETPPIVEYTVNSRLTPHADLLNAFDRLRIHVLLMCELIQSNITGKDLKEIQSGDLYIPETKNIKVTGVTWGGIGESAGVVLVAQKELSTKKVLNLITPFTAFESEDYYFSYELSKDIETLVTEVMLYIGGKSALGKQLELGFKEAA
jgi:hypothetical protein